MMITYRKACFTDEEIAQLIALSKDWVDEDISFGMVANTRDNIHEPLILALDAERIVGYIMGKFFVEEKKRSYIDIGDKCFEVEELYVTPRYRNQGIGKMLFSLMEKEVKDQVQYIVLSTSTKDYQKALNFYACKNEMTFHDAFLFKKTK